MLSFVFSFLDEYCRMCTLVIIWLILKAQQFSFSFQIQYVLIITLFTKSKEVKLLYREQTYLSSYNNIVFCY